MANKDNVTWMEDKKSIIFLTNKSNNNFILELPAGRYRLDAGRRMRTLRSILDIAQVKELVDKGELAVDKA
jgi:hypothetical protein